MAATAAAGNIHLIHFIGWYSFVLSSRAQPQGSTSVETLRPASSLLIAASERTVSTWRQAHRFLGSALTGRTCEGARAWVKLQPSGQKPISGQRMAKL